MFNYNDFLKDVNNIKKIDGAGRTGGLYSFSVVNSESNGKRITLSKALCEKLKVKESLIVVPVKEQNSLLIGANLPSDNIFTLSGNEKKICYNAGLVKFITEEFELNYTGGCTSKAFTDIELDENDGNPFAIIKMADPSPNGGKKGQQTPSSTLNGDPS